MTMSHQVVLPPTPARFARAARVGRLLLPIILTFLPVLIGWWEGGRLEESLERLEMKRLQQETDPLAARLGRTTTPAFWPEELARRLRRHVLKPASLPIIQAGGFGKVLSEALQNHGLQGLPPVRVWAARVTATSPVDLEPCRDEGLESSKAALFRSLLRETCRLARGGVSEIAAWDSRLNRMFGAAITPEFFHPSHRGRSFPVKMENTFGFLVWDVITRKRVPIGAYILFFPSGARELTFGRHYTLLNWRSRIGWPAFLTFPTRFGKTRPVVLLHPALKGPETAAILTELHDRMRPRAPRDPAYDGVGKVWLPTALEGRLFRRGNTWFRVCLLSPETGSVGVILGMVNARGIFSPSHLAILVGIILAGGWASLLWRGFRHGIWPDLRIGQALLLWFLGLVSVPVVLGVLAGASFLIDHEENLKESLVREMRATLIDADSESSRVATEQEMLFRDLVQDGALGRTLRDFQIRRDGGGLAAAKRRLWSECEQKGLEMLGVVITGHRGFLSFREKMGFSPSVTQGWLEMLNDRWVQKLGSETPAISRLLGPMREENASGSSFPLSIGADGIGEGTQLTPRSSNSLALLMERFVNPNSISGKFFLLTPIQWGKAFTTGLSAPIILEESAWYILTFFWNQEHSLRNFLREKLREVAAEAGKREFPFRVGLYGKSENTFRRVFPASLPAEIHRLMIALGGRRSLIECQVSGVPTIVQFLPGSRAQGFILVGFASLVPLRAQVIRDALLLVALLVLSLVPLWWTASVIARWLGSPLTRMSRGLDCIARGNLDVEVAEVRADELEDAGRILDGMTCHLRERRTLTRFVPPQVLEAVAGGDLQKALRAQKKHVAVLASDIRDFTTLSETHAPAEVFSALNDHLTAMTVAIQSCGGVVDRFIGDAVVGVFYPGDGPIPEHRAFSAARAMMEAHEGLLATRRSAGRFPYAIGIGIDAGTVLAGPVGDEEVRLDYSVLGEPATRAGILENLSKQGQASRIVVSERFRTALTGFEDFLPIPGDSTAWEAPTLETASTAGKEIPPCAPPLVPVGRASFSAAPAEGGEPIRSSSPDGGPAPAHAPPPFAAEHSFGWAIPGLWLVTLLLVGIMTGLTLQTAREGEELQIAQQLSERASLLVQRFDPENALTGELLSRCFAPPGTRGEDLPGKSDLASLLTRRMASLQNTFSNIQWTLGQHREPPSSATAILDGFRWGNASWGMNHPGWLQTNVGMAIPPPAVLHRGGETVISGGGLDLLQATDSFHFVHQTLPRHGRLTVRILSLTDVHPLTRAGLMIRQTPTPGAPFVSVCVSPNGVVSLLTRTVQDQPGVCVWQSDPASFPIWLRLGGDGERWVAACSRNGEQWPTVATAQVALGEAPAAGIVVGGGLWYDRFGGEDIRLVAGHGFPPALDATLINLFRAGIVGCAPAVGDFPFSPPFRHWFESEFPGLLGESTNRGFFFQDIHGNARWNSFMGRQEIRFYQVFDPTGGMGPLFDTVLETPQIPADNPSVSDRWGLLRRFSSHSFFFSLDPTSDWIETIGGLLAKELASEGVALTLTKDGRPVPIGTSLEGPDPVRFRSSFPVMRHRVSMVLSRRIALADVLARISAFPWMFFCLWLPLPLGWWIWRKATGRSGPGRLRGRLIAVFFVALLPSFVMGLLALERSGMEMETRLRAGSGDHLLQTLGQMDQGADFSRAYTRNLMRFEISPGGGVEEAFRESADPSRRERQVRKVGEVLLKRLRGKGVPVTRVVFSPRIGDSLTVTTDPTGGNPRASEFWRLVTMMLKFMLGEESPEFTPGPESRKDPTSFLLQVEGGNIRDAIWMMLGSEAAAEIFLRPENWFSIVLKDQIAIQLFGREVSSADPVLSMGFQPMSGFMERLSFPSIVSLPPGLDFEGMGFRVLWGDPWVKELVEPYLRYAEEGSLLMGPEYLTRDLPRQFQASANWAAKRNEPVFQRIGSGPVEHLFLHYPTSQYSGIVLQGRMAIGLFVEEIRQRVTGNRLILAGLLILILLLAGGVAEQFLAPVKELIRACHAITRGDFSSRLPSDWSGEFGRLATAFNAMALEAEEGRLIGRFVSDSVREIARKRSLDPAVLESRSCQAVVLFAQWSGFKQALEVSAPEALVHWLNGYLRVLSRLIRDQGGEIDKFIGDKILAVFNADPAGNLGPAVRAALAAARKMRQAAFRQSGGVEGHLGIGIVAGPLLAGILGTPELRLEYTVIGDTVNLASRLSDLAAGLPGGGALADTGFAAAWPLDPSGGEGLPFLPLPAVKVKGKARDVGIFRIREES